MIKFKSLNQSKHFLKIFKKRRLNTKYFTIYFEKNLNDTKKDDNKNLKISFVVKKKNRKRRNEKQDKTKIKGCCPKSFKRKTTD